LRDGKITEIDSEQVVPDDVLVLTTGTKIAADAEVVQSIGLQMDESALTGESFPQDKVIGEEVDAGTVVVSGEGLAVVRVTGKQTKLGAVSESLKEVKIRRTPLQLAMRSLAGKLVYVSRLFFHPNSRYRDNPRAESTDNDPYGSLVGFCHHSGRAANCHHDGIGLRLLYTFEEQFFSEENQLCRSAR